LEKFLKGNSEFQVDRMDKVLPEKFHSMIQNGYFKTFPPRDRMDGFFIARLKRLRDLKI
jgi:16S rRNA C967 or C1407 C5-methylase (RsmB/RsmF family)